MARPFSVETEESRFRLPLRTRKLIVAMSKAQQITAKELIIRMTDAYAKSEAGTQ